MHLLAAKTTIQNDSSNYLAVQPTPGSTEGDQRAYTTFPRAVLRSACGSSREVPYSR